MASSRKHMIMIRHTPYREHANSKSIIKAMILQDKKDVRANNHPVWPAELYMTCTEQSHDMLKHHSKRGI